MTVRLRLSILVLAAALALGLAAALSPVGASAAAVPGTPLDRSGGKAYWAFVTTRVVARAAPSSASRRVASLSTRTQDGTNELVAVLARATDRRGRKWVQARLPVRPNGVVGWLPTSAVATLHTVTTAVVIDRRRLRLTLRDRGRVVMTAPVGIGLPGTPTPAGHFYVRDRLQGFAPGGPYGPLAFGLSATSAVLTDWPGGGVIGIHGTNAPSLLPGVVSHGCVRMRNADVLRLARRMPVGTPVTIR